MNPRSVVSSHRFQDRLESDPNELVDLGASSEHEDVHSRMHNAIFAWATRHHSRITTTPEWIERVAGKEPRGVMIGCWDEDDHQKEFNEPLKIGS